MGQVPRSMCDKRPTCNLKNCVMKRGRRGKLEILVKRYTNVESSDTMFKIEDDANDGSTETSMNLTVVVRAKET